MKTTKVPSLLRLSVLAFLGLCLIATRTAAANDLLHPPGCDWGALVMTNVSVVDVASYEGGAIVAANYMAPEGPDLDFWGLLVKVDAAAGAVLLSTNFHGEGIHNQIRTVIPVVNASGTVTGFAFAGMKNYYTPPWGGPWVWVARLDRNLAKQAEAHVGLISHVGWGSSIAQEAGGFVVGGNDAYLTAGGYSAWIGRFDDSMNLVSSNISAAIGCERIAAVEPAAGGGYLLGTTCGGVTKVNATFEFEWQSGDIPAGDDLSADQYCVVRRTAEGCVGLGNRTGSDVTSAVLTKFTAGGGIAWSQVHADARASDLVATEDGGWLLIGTSDRNSPDDLDRIWLLKTDGAGETQWEMSLGGEYPARGIAGALAADGDFLIAGEVVLDDGTNRVWVVKLNADQHAPLPQVAFTPESPVFRDQVVTFDATASATPGSAIASYQWKFGDGTTATGPVVTHAYHDTGTNIVTLTVVNTNGALASTSRTLEVLGLALQWERSFGAYQEDAAESFVETPDGGFMIAGEKNADLWLFKTDRRGRVTWEKLINNGLGGTQSGRQIIPAHEAGAYMVLGYDYHFSNYWYEDVWLLNVDENGELLRPIQVIGEPAQDESAVCISPSLDGGYILAGRAPTNGVRMGWLYKTDGVGDKQWESFYQFPYATSARKVIPAADGGFLALFNVNGEPQRLIKTDAMGVPLWTNRLYLYDSWQWLGLREPPEEGHVLVGESGEDICMRFFDLEGGLVKSTNWTGAAFQQENDVGNYAARTPDGGYLIVGHVGLRSGWDVPVRNDLALVRTDAQGNTRWMQCLPGTTNINESGLAGVALTNGSYVILGRRETGESRVWLLKLAANHPPELRLQVSTNVSAVGGSITFDASASTDRDGSVASYEWNFGDGTTASNATVMHAFTNSGAYPVRLTVADNQDAERSLAVTNFVFGIREDEISLTLSDSSITNCPADDTVHYPTGEVPLLIDWADSRGFRVAGIATSSSTKGIRVTFDAPVPAGLTLYRMPGWTTVSYTQIDAYTIEVRLWIPAGAVNLAFVLGRTYPLPVLKDVQRIESHRLKLCFSTSAECQYRVQRTTNLANGNWTDVPHACSAEDPIASEIFVGSGSDAVLFVSASDDGAAFFRLHVELSSR